MKIAIMQPYVFPYIGYFQLINAADIFVFYDDVNFIKKGFINHNFILLNGRPYQFTIPCKSVSQNKLIKDVELHFDIKTKSKFLKTLTQAYKDAPFYKNVFPIIEVVFSENNYNSISDMAINSVKTVCDYLRLNKVFKISSIDYSGSIKLERTERLLAIIKRENCLEYINMSGGVHLYKKEDFKKDGLELKFLKENIEPYRQFDNDFIPRLSIIDLLMFNSIDDVHEMLCTYEIF